MKATIQKCAGLGFAATVLGFAWPAIAQSSFEFKARSGIVTDPFVMTNDSICQLVDTDLAGGGRAVFSFTLTNAGTYALIFFVNVPNTETNSLYVDIDNEPQDPKTIWKIPATSGFENRIVFWPENVTPGVIQSKQKNFTLAPGNHNIIVRGKAANVQIAGVILRRLPAAPTNLRTVKNP